MAVYKVPQDVEAEDKLIGPFTFKQFVLILITAFLLFLTYQLYIFSPVLSIITLPFAFITGVLGLWPRKDQPVEVYLQALIRYWFKERKRLWNQEGMVEHVIITAPKKVDHQYSDNLSRNEIQSRLKNLADSLDSRGWTAKNLEVQDVSAGIQSAGMSYTSDRLVMPQVFTPQNQPEPLDIHESDDILDTAANPVAQNFEQLAQAATQSRRQAVVAAMKGEPDASYNPYPNMQQRVVNPANAAHRVAPPTQTQPSAEPAPQEPSTSPMTPEPSPAILELSRNSDLNISTLARQAEQAEKSLHNNETIELH